MNVFNVRTVQTYILGLAVATECYAEFRRNRVARNQPMVDGVFVMSAEFGRQSVGTFNERFAAYDSEQLFQFSGKTIGDVRFAAKGTDDRLRQARGGK